MTETKFENAKVGDRVWSQEFGWGVISDTSKWGVISDTSKYGGATLIHVDFQEASNISYYLNGERYSAYYPTHQTLFWDKITIVAPPKPKRMVNKVVEGILNIYPNEVYFHKKDTPVITGDDLIETIPFRHEYEVEEWT